MAFPPLFIHELTHIILSLMAAAATCYLASREKKQIRRALYLVSFLGALLGGFFVDVDHLIDYVFAFGLHFDLGNFLSGVMFDKLQKIYVFFHAWEWVILLGIIAVHVKKPAIRYFLMALMLGLLSHLIYDTIYNHIYFFGYSIIYRIMHNFDMSAIVLH
ncbi:hypothetical protein HYS00_01605 [Candidatus Microgenomates bacterium]|nr:hypothetical protein [Candidatus Microgenomates bacterium]